jgi:hypothetical protein
VSRRTDACAGALGAGAREVLLRASAHFPDHARAESASRAEAAASERSRDALVGAERCRTARRAASDEHRACHADARSLESTCDTAQQGVPRRVSHEPATVPRQRSERNATPAERPPRCFPARPDAGSLFFQQLHDSGLGVGRIGGRVAIDLPRETARRRGVSPICGAATRRNAMCRCPGCCC